MARSAACVIVKNEARDIAEWIAYHSLLGYDALIIFDNESTDETARICKAAARQMDIHFWPWLRSDAHTQTGAYEEACRTFGAEFDWISFFDADEFLVLHKHPTIPAFLSSFADYAGVAVNWAIFGANGHEDYHTDLVVESFTRRSVPEFFQNRHVKSFVRPRTVIECPNPHFFQLEGQYCDPSGQAMEWLHNVHGATLPGGVSAREPDYANAQLNHYFTRSRAHWGAKVRRGYPADIAVRKLEEFSAYDRNEVEDRSATARSPEVRALTQKITDAACG